MTQRRRRKSQWRPCQQPLHRDCPDSIWSPYGLEFGHARQLPLPVDQKVPPLNLVSCHALVLPTQEGSSGEMRVVLVGVVAASVGSWGGGKALALRFFELILMGDYYYLYYFSLDNMKKRQGQHYVHTIEIWYPIHIRKKFWGAT